MRAQHAPLPPAILVVIKCGPETGPTAKRSGLGPWDQAGRLAHPDPRRRWSRHAPHAKRPRLQPYLSELVRIARGFDNCIIDGEVCSVRKDGITDFSGLQAAMKAGKTAG